MDEKQFQRPIDAIHDLREYLKAQGVKAIPKDVLNACSDDRRHLRGSKKYPVMYSRIERLCNKYAPGRYRFVEVVTLADSK